MGKARHPHDASRPIPKAVQKALDKGDMDALARALTPRQVAFAREYVVDFVAKKAAVRSGYSAKYAEQQAHILLKHDGVRKLVEHYQLSNQAKAVAINPDWVTDKIVAIVNTAERTSDQLRGLELVAKILGMLKDKTEISGPDGEAIQVMNRKIEEDSKALTDLIEGLATKRKLSHVSDV